MKIAVSFPGCHRRGGVERVVYECASYLASRGHEVDVFAEECELVSQNNIRFRHVEVAQRPKFLRPKRYFDAATRMVSELEPAILNTHGCVCPTGGVQWVQSVHAAWLERSKTMRSAMSVSRVKQILNPVHPVLLNLEQRHFRERAYKRLIATTPIVAADLHRLYGVPLEDVTIIPNGFNPQEFNPQLRAERREEMRKKLGLHTDQIALLFVANELPRKGYGVLLKALKLLNDPRIRLLVVGRPSQRDVRNWAANEGIENQILALGTSSDVAGMHAAADLFVLPTQYEAFSLAILESLGSGLPVVTTSVPGAGDAIQSGKNGAIVKDALNHEELASVLRPLITHEVLSRLSSVTAETVAKYQWPHVLQEYERVLMESM
jgi:UDP-glucose:(heptosyl)LPS alpha-1,3-glucosyltransferase